MLRERDAQVKMKSKQAEAAKNRDDHLIELQRKVRDFTMMSMQDVRCCVKLDWFGNNFYFIYKILTISNMRKVFLRIKRKHLKDIMQDRQFVTFSSCSK